MENRYTIITGANRGIGLEIAKELASRSIPLVLACRRIESAESTRQLLQDQGADAPIEVMVLDLSSFGSVIAFTQLLKERKIPVGQLLNNAGVIHRKYEISDDGFEMNWQVNYLSVYLLSRLVAEILPPKGLILNTTSLTRKCPLSPSKPVHPNPRYYIRLYHYGQSKAALTFFTLALSRRLEENQIRVNAADPWIVATEMIQMGKWFDPLAKRVLSHLVYTPLKGAQSAIKGATDPDFLSQTGCLFVKEKMCPFSRRFRQRSFQDRLWQETESIFTERYPGIFAG